MNRRSRLVSARKMSRHLHADQRAVLGAYHQLAAAELVSLRPRSGVFVHAERSSSMDAPLPEVASWVVDVLLRGMSLGMTYSESCRQARLCLDGRRIGVVCLECNGDQMYALCRQLRDDYGFESTGVDINMLSQNERLPRKATGAELVVTTRFHVAEGQQLGRRLGRPVLVATLDPVFVSKIRRMLAQGPVWWVCTDARFASKLSRMWPESSVTPVVLGRDSLDTIPAEAIVYATRAASERLPPCWRAGRVVTVPQVFSPETARRLLAFQVGRNLQTAAAPTPLARSAAVPGSAALQLVPDRPAGHAVTGRALPGDSASMGRPRTPSR